MKKLLSIFIMGSEIRQFVHSGLFSLMSENDWSITIMAKIIDSDLRAQISETIDLIPILPVKIPFLANEMSVILDKAFNIRRARQGSSTWQYGRKIAKNWRQSLLQKLETILANGISISNYCMTVAGHLENYLYKSSDRTVWRKYFSNNPTDAILVNVPRQNYWNPMLITAHEMGIKTYLVYHTAKDIVANGRLNHDYDGIGVWNTGMKQALLEQNPWVNPESVRVVGCGHFDCVGRMDWLPDESEFRDQIGAKPDSLLIIYPTAGPGIVPQEERYIEFVVKAASAFEDRLGKSVQIVFRMNPMDSRDILHDYLKQTYPRHIVLRPDWVDIRKNNWTYAKMTDPILYNALLHFSSLCITIPSTVTLDAALAGIPVINLGIEVPGEQPLAGSIRAFWDVDFNKNVRESGAARYVTNQNELEEALINYLQNKYLDADKRSELINREVDGITAGRSSLLSLHMIESN